MLFTPIKGEPEIVNITKESLYGYWIGKVCFPKEMFKLLKDE